MWEISVPSSSFCCEPKTARKNKGFFFSSDSLLLLGVRIMTIFLLRWHQRIFPDALNRPYYHLVSEMTYLFPHRSKNYWFQNVLLFHSTHTSRTNPNELENKVKQPNPSMLLEQDSISSLSEVQVFPGRICLCTLLPWAAYTRRKVIPVCVSQWVSLFINLVAARLSGSAF